MNGELALAISYFGKLPSRGDFLKASDSNPQLIAILDRWAGQGIELLAQDDVAWKQLYDMGSALHFSILGSRSRAAIGGYLLPSSDASGRRYPFMAAVTMDVPQPLPFLSRSPLAFSRLGSRLERETQRAKLATDPAEILTELTSERVSVNVLYEVLNPAFLDFLEMQTVSSLETLLGTAGHAVSLRRILLALGVLLQPVMSSKTGRIGKGLVLPLPKEPLYRNLVATLWLDLIAGFLSRGDFELLVLTLHSEQPALLIGFNGVQGRSLQAAFDHRVIEQDFIPLHDPEWVEEHVRDEYALKKLSTYASQEGLSLSTARNTFRETFLGA